MQSQSEPVMGDGLKFEATPEPVPPELEQAPLELEPAPLESEAQTPAPEPGLPTAASLEILRKTREERGESLNDIARTLKIAAHQLEAIENGRFDVLPGPTFARGFLRNYARYLDIPPEPLLEGISARTPTAADLASMIKLDGNVQPAASPRPQSSVLPAVLIVLVALALAGLVGAGLSKGWFGFRFELPKMAPAHGKATQLPAHEKTAQLPAKVVQPQAKVAQPSAREKAIQLKPVVIKLEQPVPVNIAPESAIDPLLAGGDPAGMPAAPVVATLRLSFNASTFAQVRDNSEKLIFTRTGAKGSTNSIKGKPPFSVMVMQPNNVKLEFNGEPVDLKGHTGRDGVARLTLE
jgi:cytoskeleton protein RodZ